MANEGQDRRANRSENGESWHLSKSIPISLVLAIVVQTMGGIWWASSISSEVAHIKERLKTIPMTIPPPAVARRITALEVLVGLQGEAIKDLRQQLRQARARERNRSGSKDSR